MVDTDLLVEINQKIAADQNAPLSSLFSSWKIRDYASLFFIDLRKYPFLNARLPKMPSSEAQRHWSWFTGKELMEKCISFSETTKEMYEKFTSSLLSEATVLDYGAGWGRLTRMMLQFVPESRVHACDADPKSVSLFNSLSFRTTCMKVPSNPLELPLATGAYDLVWLWSIFTHLPFKAINSIMISLRRIIQPNGMLLISIRPASFWCNNPIVAKVSNIEELVEEHEKAGFAHHASSPYWGDTSMSVDFIKRMWPHWNIVCSEDEGTHQVRVYLTPK